MPSSLHPSHPCIFLLMFLPSSSSSSSFFLILFRYFSSPFYFSSTPSSFFPPPPSILLAYICTLLFLILLLKYSTSTCTCTLSSLYPPYIIMFLFSCSSLPAPPHLSFYSSFPYYPPLLIYHFLYPHLSFFLLLLSSSSSSTDIYILLFLILLLRSSAIYRTPYSLTIPILIFRCFPPTLLLPNLFLLLFLCRNLPLLLLINPPQYPHLPFLLLRLSFPPPLLLLLPHITFYIYSSFNKNIPLHSCFTSNLPPPTRPLCTVLILIFSYFLLPFSSSFSMYLFLLLPLLLWPPPL